MSNMIYPLEKQIQEQLSHSNLEKAADLSICEIRIPTTLTVKAWPDTVENVQEELSAVLGGSKTPEFGKCLQANDLICVCNNPGQYLLLSEHEGFDVTLNAEDAAVTDISHTRCGLMIEGTKACSLLNKGLAFPLDDENLPAGSFTQGSIHSVGLLIFKMDKDKFALFFYSSFAISFFEWVIDSALEYGYALSDKAISLIEQ